MAASSEEQWKFTIYFVGFPDSKRDSPTIPIATMMKTLIPEARVLKHNIFQGNTSNDSEDDNLLDELADTEDGCGPDNPYLDNDGTKDGTSEETPHVIGLEYASETSATEFNTPKRNFFLPEWIDDEATGLLTRIKRNTARDKRLLRRKIVLAGYGFGGFIIKRAVIMANSSLRFHDLALTIDTLTFIGTPHRPSRQLAWEELLLKMLNTTNRSYRGRLSEILSGLIGSVSQLSSVFYKFAAKYKITNIIGKDGSDEYEPMIFNSTFEEVISRSQTDDEILCCSIHDMKYLELMRTAFTPRQVSQDINSALDTYIQEHQVQLGIRIDCYFKLLQRLSPSRWLIYSSITTECMEDHKILKRFYELFLNIESIKEILGCSVEIVSPKIHGGSALLKLLCREIIESSSAVLIESNSGPQTGEGSRYNMYMSFIHQIISQRPSLFLPVQSLATEILSQNIWTEEVLHHLLSSILIHSDGTHFDVAIYDFESWPLELRSWLSMMQTHISEANGSTLSILTCSRNEITGLTREKVHKITLSPERHAWHITAFIHEKVDHFLGQNLGSASARAKLKAHILQTAIPLAQSFEGSFSTISAYLLQLIHSIPRTSIKEITESIQDIPATTEAIYKHCLQELFHKPKAVLYWATKVLSWLLLAVRPLHIEELAVAAALRSEHLTLHNVRNDISIDMEKDIREHLGPLVRIEGRFAFLDSRELKNILLQFDENSPKKLNILRDQDIARLSLRYLRLTITHALKNKATWENCLSQVSYKRQGRDHDDPDLHFLEYACRFWPVHFHRGGALDRNTNIEATKFFTLQSDIPNMWFRLYLLCHGDIPKAFTKSTECQEVEAQVLDAHGAVMDEEDSYQTQTAAEMADYIGLSTVILSSLPESEANTSFKEITLRRGYWDHKVVIRDAKSRNYQDLIIDNDDTVNEFFSANLKEMSGHFPLHRAAISGCLGATEVLFNLLSNHNSANHNSILSQINSDGRTPFHVAALCGSQEVLQFLFNKAVSDNLPGATGVGDILDVRDSYSETAFMLAVRIGNVAAAKSLLEFGATVNIQDDVGNTALHFAASNCPQLIRSLMNPSNDAAFTVDRDGCIPLHIAIKCGNRDAASFLLEAYRQLGRLSQAVGAKDNAGKTPLHYAAEQGFEDIALLLTGMVGKKRVKMNDIQRAAELAAMNGHLATLRAIMGQEEIRDFGHEVLNAAVNCGQLLVVYYLLQNNVSPNEKLKDGNVILSTASSKGFAEIVRTLLEHSADVSAVDSERRTPLHHAIKHARYKIAKMLLAHKSSQPAEIEVHDLERYTPLHYAARAGNAKMVNFLLQRNANIDTRSRKKETPLHVAVKSPEVMRLLIDAGADLGALDHIERTPLHLAVSESSIECVRFLLEQGARWDAVDYEKKSPMRYAIDANDATIVEAMIQSQSMLQKCPEISWDDLVSALKYLKLETVKVLVNQLPSIISQGDEDGNTLLHWAAQFSEVGLINLLLDAGSTINRLNNLGGTPLHCATFSNKIDNLRLLINRGGLVDECGGECWTPLHSAAYHGYVESAVALIDAGASIDRLNALQMTPLYLAAERNMNEMVECLLWKGANPNMTANGGWSPLQTYISSDNPDEPGAGICDLLISYNANINHQTDDLWTPLHLAIDWPKEHAMKYLLENGADPNIPNQDGWTAFHLSFNRGLTQLMLGHPNANIIDLEKKTSTGLAPIHLAVQKSELEIVELLIAKGVELKVKTSDDLSCLDIAAVQDTSDILDILLDGDWRSDDIVLAYWLAIEKVKVGNVEMLVKKQKRLLDKISEEGLNGLETCLLRRPGKQS